MPKSIMRFIYNKKNKLNSKIILIFHSYPKALRVRCNHFFSSFQWLWLSRHLLLGLAIYVGTSKSLFWQSLVSTMLLCIIFIFFCFGHFTLSSFFNFCFSHHIILLLISKQFCFVYPELFFFLLLISIRTCILRNKISSFNNSCYQNPRRMMRRL